jgi:hypothetical protein
MFKMLLLRGVVFAPCAQGLTDTGPLLMILDLKQKRTSVKSLLRVLIGI